MTIPREEQIRIIIHGRARGRVPNARCRRFTTMYPPPTRHAPTAKKIIGVSSFRIFFFFRFNLFIIYTIRVVYTRLPTYLPRKRSDQGQNCSRKITTHGETRCTSTQQLNVRYKKILCRSHINVFRTRR